ncbi:MAG: DNA mismatch repair protein MutS [Roseovarius sp.]|nr:DNA mismatch repair protein MutS [Roseovarius sp.]
MMEQYHQIKANHSDALLFYRMGDFYELFFNDAILASEALDISLTRRGKSKGTDIPMCGVPVHSAEGYLHSLIKKGFRVAVCEQMEDPAETRKRGSRAVVKREVVRLITPGTITEEGLLDARRHNFLAALSNVRGEHALAWADISTGLFNVSPIHFVQLGPELSRLLPSELLVAEGFDEGLERLASEFECSLTPLGAASFDSTNGLDRLCNLFEVSTLDAFGEFGRPEIAAMGAIVDYLEITQKGSLPILRPPKLEFQSRSMQIDAATRRNMELTFSLFGGRKGSLLSVMDRTVTAAGGRLLERRLSSPVTDCDIIRKRLDAVQHMEERPDFCRALRRSLRKVPDMDRALSRLAIERGGPRDLASIRNGLIQSIEISSIADALLLPEILETSFSRLKGHDELLETLGNAIVHEPPLYIRDGGFIADGYNGELDETRLLRDEGRGVVASLQSEYRKLTGIQSLKIKHNNVLGYFVDVTSTHAEKMLSEPLSETFRHRQTTANQLRFTTVRLSEMETRILNAGRQAIETEKRLFEYLKAAVLEWALKLAPLAEALAELDLCSSLAELARSESWCRPNVDESRSLLISGARHPVVEHSLKSQSERPFIENDCELGNGCDIWLLTGPNMAGKSTFLRQNAIIAILAQMGSYVPARTARIGIVSQLFSRVGASDDLARGRSTFMVEMVETAMILNQADRQALVILDEIGRGTATYDGLSIAWATLEHLHEVNGCRALFATHYHELTNLSDRLERSANATVAVREHRGEIIFLHSVRKGAADRSYGVQVAKLAGLPDSVIKRAKVVLEALEKGEREGGNREALIDDLPLFSIAAKDSPSMIAQEDSKLHRRLAEVLPDEMTPRQALDLIYELKRLSREAESRIEPAGPSGCA